MKTKILLTIVIILAQLAFALVPLFPWARTLLPESPTLREQLEWQVQVTSISLALLTACVGFILLLADKDRRDFQNEVASRLPGVVVHRLRDDEFYRAFLNAASTARSTVSIMYLAPRPPDDTKNKDRVRYYQDILDVIKRRKEVRFTRILRVTPKTKPWIAKLIGDLEGCSNAYVGGLKEHETEEVPLSLSTQIADQEKVWFVALADHERKGSYRDLYVESPMLAEGMQLYYDRLWGRSDKYLDAGRLTDAGRKLINQCPTT